MCQHKCPPINSRRGRRQSRKRVCSNVLMSDCKTQKDSSENRDCYDDSTCGQSWTLITLSLVTIVVSLAVLFVMYALYTGRTRFKVCSGVLAMAMTT